MSSKPLLRALLVALLPPALLVAAGVGYIRVQEHRLRAASVDPADIRWTLGGTPHTVRIATARDGEVQRFDVRVVAASGKVVHRTEYAIDWDLFGAGFVRGMQLDEDPEIELAMVRRGDPRASRYIDPAADRVVERPFAEASAAARARAAAWLEAYVRSIFAGGITVLAAVLWLLGAVAWYLALAPLLRLARGRRSGAGQ